MSVPGDYFPTTLDRCLAMSGEEAAVITFLWNLGLRAPEVMNTLTLILPNSAVSAIIGHSGNIIKMMQEKTGARIKVENRMDHVKERVVRISSTNGENVYQAFKQVLDKINGDPQLRINMHVSYLTTAPQTTSKPTASWRTRPISQSKLQQYFQQYYLASSNMSFNGVSVRPVGTRTSLFSRPPVATAGTIDHPISTGSSSRKRKLNDTMSAH